MAAIKIQHYRKNCIGCNACVQFAPQTWDISTKDGKAVLKNGQGKNDVFTSEIDPEDLDDNQKAAMSCPTRIIKIIT